MVQGLGVSLVHGPPGATLKPLARHLLVEMRGCPEAVLADQKAVREALSAVAGTVATSVVFDRVAAAPNGSLTGMLMGEDAHVVIRTWPRDGIATADVVVSPERRLAACIAHLVGVMHPSSHLTLEMGRGIAAAPDPSSAVG